MSEHTQCVHVKDDGERCQSSVALSDAGLCFMHDPARAEAAARARKLGNEAVKAKAREERGLEDAELPPLDSHASAERWADVVGRAVASGRLDASAGNVMMRCVREWREARSDGAVSDQLDALTSALNEWRQTGSPERVLALVEGKAS